MKSVETLDAWYPLRDRLMIGGYTVFQLQYDIDCPQGFYACFCSYGRPDIEITTHDPEVYKAIMAY